MPPRGLLQNLGNVARHIPGPFVRPMLHYQEGVVILLQDCPQLGRKAKALLTFSSTMISRSSWRRMPERMPVIKRILNCCRWGLPFQSVQHLLRGDEDGSMVSGMSETASRSWISLIIVGGLREY